MDEINFYAQFFEHPPYYCTLYTQSYYSTITVYGSTLLHVYMQAHIINLENTGLHFTSYPNQTDSSSIVMESHLTIITKHLNVT